MLKKLSWVVWIMAHLNMTYSNTNNAKPLSITMLKNHVGGTSSLNCKQQPDTIFLDSTIRLCCLFFIKDKMCLYQLLL